MEITVKVVLSADANFLAVLQSILQGKIAVDRQPSSFTSNGNGAATEEKQEKKTRKSPQEKLVAKLESVTAPVDNEPHTITVTDPVETIHTLDSLREIAVPLSKAGHKDAIKKTLSDLGYDSLAKLEPKDFQTFYDYLQTLS